MTNPIPTITREQFVAAIEAGIAAEPSLDDDSRAKLREVAATARTFGINFDTGPGCPATLAGVYDVLTTDPETGSSRGLRFGCGFDRCVVRYLPAYGSVDQIDVIEV